MGCLLCLNGKEAIHNVGDGNTIVRDCVCGVGDGGGGGVGRPSLVSPTKAQESSEHVQLYFHIFITGKYVVSLSIKSQIASCSDLATQLIITGLSPKGKPLTLIGKDNFVVVQRGCTTKKARVPHCSDLKFDTRL